MLFEKIQETADYIRNLITSQPKTGIILGSGLGLMAGMMEPEIELPYAELPHFPKSTVQGHAGKLIIGKLDGRDALLMAGRFHYYEGYDMSAVTFPVRVMRALGIDTLLVSNAAGGMKRDFKIGDIMLINDHINLFPEHPLRGPNDDRLGTRFPDMSRPYCPDLLQKARNIAAEQHIRIQEGVYVGIQGPTFETAAEYRWLDRIGGDAVGMSTVPEVIVALHSGMKVFAASIITDLGFPENLHKITHQEVLEAAQESAPKLARIFSGLVTELIVQQ